MLRSDKQCEEVVIEHFFLPIHCTEYTCQKYAWEGFCLTLYFFQNSSFLGHLLSPEYEEKTILLIFIFEWFFNCDTNRTFENCEELLSNLITYQSYNYHM